MIGGSFSFMWSSWSGGNNLAGLEDVFNARQPLRITSDIFAGLLDQLLCVGIAGGP